MAPRGLKTCVNNTKGGTTMNVFIKELVRNTLVCACAGVLLCGTSKLVDKVKEYRAKKDSAPVKK